jgi:hypothetical protein
VKTVRKVTGWIAIGLLVASLVQQLRKPPAERTWQGRLAGLVPYDWRFPTLQRIRATLWNPSSPRLLVPQAFGVGWTLNVGALAHGLGALRRDR